MVGGSPGPGMLFGAAHNAEAVMPCSTMIDLIHGGRLDTTVLGCAEVRQTELQKKKGTIGSDILVMPAHPLCTKIITSNQELCGHLKFNKQMALR